VDRRLSFEALVEDGTRVEKGQIIAQISGAAKAILAAERTALNFLQHLSGIATLTAHYVELLKPYKATLKDTRKTTPGLRELEKYAVRCGGGQNHRLGLYDGVLIKDNHIVMAGGVSRAIKLARQNVASGFKIEVEVQNLAQVKEALDAGADVIMLDNMDPNTLRQAVELIAGRTEVEVSGGIDEGTLAQIAELGVDYISIGALTHSAPAVDIHLKLA